LISFAAATGIIDIVTALLDAGAPPNSVPDGTPPPLTAAAGEAQIDVVRLLLDRGAFPNGSDGKIGFLWPVPRMAISRSSECCWPPAPIQKQSPQVATNSSSTHAAPSPRRFARRWNNRWPPQAPANVNVGRLPALTDDATVVAFVENTGTTLALADLALVRS
jgi:hypothetical protein